MNSNGLFLFKILFMKKTIVFLSALLLCLATENLFASEKGLKSNSHSTQVSFTGVVVDKVSNEKLAGVTVQFPDAEKKIYTDAKGEFNISGISPGTYTVKINCISYKDREVLIKVTKSQNEKIKVQLSPIEP